jgi:spore maturation protein CgeB
MRDASTGMDRFDWYFMLSRSCMTLVRELGHTQVSYQPHSVDFDIFHPEHRQSHTKTHKYDVCFVGYWSKKRQKFMEAALEVTRNIAIYGPKWRARNWSQWSVLRCIKGKYIFGAPLTHLYNRTAVVLNITNWGDTGDRPRSGMNMRVMEAPACGAFLLTDASLELGEFLTPGVHLATYDNLDHFQSQLAYYLDNPEQREKIAQQGLQHIQKGGFTYDAFVSTIIHVFNTQEKSRLFQTAETQNTQLCS